MCKIQSSKNLSAEMSLLSLDLSIVDLSNVGVIITLELINVDTDNELILDLNL